MNDTIWIASDHGGLVLKKAIVEYLEEHDIPYHDAGCHSQNIVRYPNYAAEVCSRISSDEISRGILICSTGIGMSIIANKYPGVRASLCHTVYDGRMTRAHNDSNCLCLGGRIIGDFQAIEILKAWLEGEYEGGRHEISLGLIRDAEAFNLTGQQWRNAAFLKQTT